MQPLNESDLNISNISSQNTSMDSDSVGGKKRKNNTIKRCKNKKSYKKYSYKRNKKNKRGGRGVGANNYDPNFNIYNSNMLTLFPYKPIN
jgi:hypothetical protein